MPKHIYPLKPCPWCKTTPKFYMMYRVGKKLEDTYLPEIYCENEDCKVHPRSKYVPIRKKQRFDKQIIKDKIERAIGYWNDGNPMIATEGIEIDFEEIANYKEI